MTGFRESPISASAPARRRLGADAGVRRHGVVWAVWLLLVLLGRPAAAVDGASVRVVPADDAPLATMLLIGAGQVAPVLLFDPRDQVATTRFLAEAGMPVECLVRPALSAAVRALLESATNARCRTVTDLVALARELWPEATRAVLVPAARYSSLLRGAAFAGAIGAALVPVDGSGPLAAERFDGWGREQLYVLPGAEAAIPTDWPPERIMRLNKSGALMAELLQRLPQPPQTLVVANPTDREGRFSPAALSLLAPLLAAAHAAPLVVTTNPDADAAESAVAHVIAARGLAPSHLYLVGDELALRSHRVPDPVVQAGGPEPIGGGKDVRVELFSEIEHERPQDYAVGRLVAEDAAQASAIVARQLHRRGDANPRVAVLSNADQEFALGETISRTTVSELQNRGMSVKARYGAAVTSEVIRHTLEKADVVVWEGHARDLTLEERGGIAIERAPRLVVLQGCYTLDRSDPFILFERGTQAVVATSAAIYSASGSAFARAFFDAVLYDGADLGTAVRNARNYLLAVSELKKQRGHSDWTKTYRAALAFALWGDPTAAAFAPPAAPKLPPASWRLVDHALRLTVPKRPLDAATVGPYSAQPVPRAMLGGLVLRDGDKPEREAKSLFYTAQPAPPDVTAACRPAPGWEVVSLFAPHTHTLSVLARPPGDTPGSSVPAGDFTLPLVPDPAACAPHP